SVCLSGSKTLRLRELTRPSAQASEVLSGDDRGSILALVGDSMDNSSTFLELKPHIMNRTSHPIRAMPNLRPDIAQLIAINVDEQLIQALVQFWDPAYQCFTFNQEYMTPTIEEYASMLCIDNIRKKNEVSCVPWFSLRDLVQNHTNILKRVDLFALAIYGLVVFPKHLGSVLLLYMCRNQDWVPLLGLWGVAGYAPLMAQRQFGEGYMKNVLVTANSWREIYLMELAFYADTITLDYDIWRQQRVKNQLTLPTDYAFQNSFSKEVLSELEMERHEFEREKTKLLQYISSLQEENYQLKIDVQIEKSKTEKVQKEAEIMRKDLKDLYLENKKLRGTIRNKLKGKIRDLENTLQAHQQHLDDLLRALEEKNGQHDRNVHTYEIDL
ncbi:hypothetical protein Golax_023993, partial [Gossypium laxum]|nr:hypothetical protein [Gossypium laxum]